MILRKLIYVSDATVVFDEEMAVALAQRSALRNRGLGVTGFLVMRDGSFLQYLEGPPEGVEEIWQRVEADGRHEICNYVAYQLEDATRVFPDWHMRYLGIHEPAAATTLVLEQMFRQMTIPDAAYARSSLEGFIAKIAADLG